MAVIGEIAVNVVANTGGLERGIARSKGAIKSFEGFLSSSKLAILGWTGAVVGMALAIERQRSAIDDLNDQASRLNATFNGLTSLQYAAKLSGDSFDTLTGALGQMQARLGEVASTGKGSAAAAFQRLKINASELIGLKSDQAFAEIAEKLKGVGSQAERSSLAMDIFGKSGKEILNTVNLGADGLGRMANEAKALGLTLSEDAVKGVADLGDEIDRLMARLKGVPRQAVGGASGWLAEALAGRRQAFEHLNEGRPQDDVHNPYFMVPFLGKLIGQYQRIGTSAPGLTPQEQAGLAKEEYKGPESQFGRQFFGAAGGLYNRYLGSNVNMAGGALSMLPQAMGMMEGKLNSMSWEIFKRKAFGYLYKTEKEEAKKESPIAVGLNRAIDYNSNEAATIRAQAKREAEILDELKRQTKLMEATKPEQSIKLEGWKIN